MEIFDDTQALFRQLNATPGTSAVKTVIENHDAWTHSHVVEEFVGAWTRLNAVPRDPAAQDRIVRQRQALQALVTCLPHRYASAG